MNIKEIRLFSKEFKEKDIPPIGVFLRIDKNQNKKCFVIRQPNFKDGKFFANEIIMPESVEGIINLPLLKKN
jgi:hypothetical protein